MVESVGFNRHALHAIQLEDAWENEIMKQAHVKQEAQDITSPIRSEITYFEGDRPLLQEVWPMMKSLRDKVLGAISGNLKSKCELEKRNHGARIRKA